MFWISKLNKRKVKKIRMLLGLSKKRPIRLILVIEPVRLFQVI
jgi:hypothetical protein